MNVRYGKKELVGEECITKEEVMQSLRLDQCEDEEIDRLIKAARNFAEDYTNLQIVPKTFSLYLNDVPDYLECSKIPVMDLVSVTVFTKEGDPVDITSDYDLFGENIIRTNSSNLPELRPYDTTEIVVKCGMEEVSAKIKEAMLWLIYHKYYKTPAKEWFAEFKSLLSDIRVRTI